MTHVTLIGISKKGRERIKQWGETWRVEEVREGRVLLRSLCDCDWRWVALENDPHFTISDPQGNNGPLRGPLRRVLREELVAQFPKRARG